MPDARRIDRLADLFERDHAPGNLVLTASRWPGLVVPEKHRPAWMPGPYALALHMRGEVPLEAEGKHLELGHLMEPVAERLLKRRDPRIVLVGIQPRFEDLDIPAVCYPDGEDDRSRLVEIKTIIGGESAYAERWENGPPLHVRAQAQAQMLIAKREVCLIVPIIIGYAGIRCEVFETEADSRMQEVLLEAADDFMAILKTGGLPEPDASESSYRALLKSTTLAKGKSLLLPGTEMVELAAAWRENRRIEKDAKAGSERAKHEFAALMGDAEEGVLDDGSTVRRSLVKESTYTVERKASWRWNV